MSSPNKRKESTYEDLSQNEDDQELNNSGELQKSEVWRSQIEMLKETIKDKEKYIETLKKKQKNKDIQIQDLQSQVQELNNKMKSNTYVHPKGQEEMLLKDQQIEELTNEKCLIQKQFKQLSLEYEELGKRLDDEKMEKQQMMRQKAILNSRVEEELMEKQLRAKEKANLQGQIERLTDKIKGLDEKVAQLNLSLQNNFVVVKPQKILKGDNQMSKQIDELKEKNKKLQQEVQRLSNKMSERRENDGEQQIENLKEELQYAQTDLQAEKEKNKVLKKEKEQFIFTIKNYENKIKSLEIKVIQLEESGQIGLGQNGCDDKKNSEEVNKLEQELSEISKQLDSLLDSKIELERINKLLASENEDLKEKVSVLGLQLENIQQSVINVVTSERGQQQNDIEKQISIMADQPSSDGPENGHMFGFTSSKLTEEGVNSKEGCCKIWQLNCKVMRQKQEMQRQISWLKESKKQYQDEMLKQISILKSMKVEKKRQGDQRISLNAQKINELINVYFANIKEGNKKIRAFNLINYNLEQIQI